MTARRTLPHRRYCETVDLRHQTETGDQAYSVSVGFSPEGDPAEIFVNKARTGSSLEAIARDGAILLSIALQYGVPCALMRNAITRDQNGAPSSIIGAVLDLLANDFRENRP